MKEPIRLLVADDHRVMRKGLVALLRLLPDISVIGEADNGQQALECAIAMRPDVIVLDLSMPVMDGLATIQAVKKMDLPSRILILTSFSEDDRVFAAIRAGALGYILKDAVPEELVEAIKTVHRGEPWLSPNIAQKLVRQVHRATTQPASTEEPLTDREVEVLRLVATGLSNVEIADRLIISERTVGAHISRILDKLRLSNRTQAALYALRQGLVKPQEIAVTSAAASG